MTGAGRLIALSLATWGVGEGMFVYFLPIYMRELGAGPVQIGTIFGLAGALMALLHLPAGMLSDRFGPKGVLAAGWIQALLATWLMYAARSLPVFAAGLMVYMMTFYIMSPMASYLTASRGRWTTARTLTTVSAAYNLGAAVGPLIGGQVGEAIGLRPIFAIAGVLFVISTALILLIARQEPLRNPGPGNGREALARPAMIGFLTLVMLGAFGMYLSWPLTPNYLQEVHGVTLAQIGLFGSLNALGIVALNLGLGRLEARTGYMLAQAAVGLSVALLWRGSGLAGFGLGYLLAGGYRTFRSLVAAMIETQVEASGRGRAYGVAETVQGLALLLAPPLAGLLYRSDPALPYPVALAVIALVLLLNARFAPRARAEVTIDGGPQRRDPQ